MKAPLNLEAYPSSRDFLPDPMVDDLLFYCFGIWDLETR
jgi:hypothetical protein